MIRIWISIHKKGLDSEYRFNEYETEWPVRMHDQVSILYWKPNTESTGGPPVLPQPWHLQPRQLLQGVQEQEEPVR